MDSTFDFTALVTAFNLASSDPVSGVAVLVAILAGLFVAYRKRKQPPPLSVLPFLALFLTLTGCLTAERRNDAIKVGRSVCEVVTIACDKHGGLACVLVDSACHALSRVKITPVVTDGVVSLVFCETFDRDEIEITPSPGPVTEGEHVFSNVTYNDNGTVTICDTIPWEVAE